jgi:hypothetical protein
MAEPARRNADGPEPGDPERKPDPRASGWAGAQAAMAIAAQACALAVTELAARPGETAALEMAGLCRAMLENLGDTIRRLDFSAEVMAEERARAYAEGYRACKKDRCRLAVVDGG